MIWLPRFFKERMSCNNCGEPFVEQPDAIAHHTGLFTCFEWFDFGIVIWGEDYKPPLRAR